jgi:hypothetical protein
VHERAALMSEHLRAELAFALDHDPINLNRIMV